MYNFYNSILDIIINKIIPMTEKNIIKGNKIFAATILNKKDLSVNTI